MCHGPQNGHQGDPPEDDEGGDVEEDGDAVQEGVVGGPHHLQQLALVQEEGVNLHQEGHHVEGQPLTVDDVVVEHPTNLH